MDGFRVPAAARAEFLERVGETHAFLRRQPGFVEDHLLEKTAGPGMLNLVTIAVWADAAAVEAAKAAVQAWRRETGFDPQALMTRLGIEAELGNYRKIER